jgi:hypothetical protein
MDLYIRKEIKMSSTKLLASILLVLAVMFAQVGNVAAAPQTQDATPITGTVQSITTETDANGVTTVLVTLMDDQGATQTVRLSVDTAVALNLITLDPTTQEPVVDDTQVGQTVEIDPTTVIPDEAPTEPDVHPISWLLAQFFFDGDPDMAAAIDSFHNGDFTIIGDDGTEQTLDQVFGFGVIAQSLWMSRNLTEDGTADADLAGLILQAKQTGDYSEFTLPDGTSLWGDGDAPTNWGQFKKALLDKKHNLGVIVSGQADPDSSTDPLLTQQHGNGKDKENKGKGKDKNKNHP